MVTGWRRVFCTTIPKEKETPISADKAHDCENNTTASQSPKISSKFGFFSNPSTPKLESQPVTSPSLRCRTSITTSSTSSVPNSPKLQCRYSSTPKKNNSPRLFHFSNPSSPRSPSSFSFLKASLRLSKSRCGICVQSVKAGQGTAIFTAECSHTFHFPCIAAHVKKQQLLLCPVCSTAWKEYPALPFHSHNDGPAEKSRGVRDSKTKFLRVYDDDEPLMSALTVARFNPIPESDENEDELEHIGNFEFQGFFAGPSVPPLPLPRETFFRNVELRVLPEAAIIAVGRGYETYSVMLRVKAPAFPIVNNCRRTKALANRVPVDLVMVIDVGGGLNLQKLQMMKSCMRSVISFLGYSDRLSIVAFSSTSKRLFALRRMTSGGQRSARRIVDALVAVDQVRDAATAKNDAIKKAAKVIQDRRDKNPIASILLVSEFDDDRISIAPFNTKVSYPLVSSTRFGHLEIPIHTVSFADGGACGQPPNEDVFSKIVGGVLSVVAQDFKLQLGVISRAGPVDIAGVYSVKDKPESLGSGSIRVGDLNVAEEREFLVELKVPTVAVGSHHVMSVRSSYRDPSSQEVVYSKEQAYLLPRPRTVRSSNARIEQLRNIHVTTRAIAESRRLIEHNDVSGAHHLLSSARALLMKSSPTTADVYLRCLEAELHRSRRQRNNPAEEKGEPIAPTSAWRAAERLAKVAIMRKSMNRVSDLHGFENARF